MYETMPSMPFRITKILTSVQNTNWTSGLDQSAAIVWLCLHACGGRSLVCRDAQALACRRADAVQLDSGERVGHEHASRRDRVVERDRKAEAARGPRQLHGV